MISASGGRIKWAMMEMTEPCTLQLCESPPDYDIGGISLIIKKLDVLDHAKNRHFHSITMDLEDETTLEKICDYVHNKQKIGIKQLVIESDLKNIVFGCTCLDFLQKCEDWSLTGVNTFAKTLDASSCKFTTVPDSVVVASQRFPFGMVDLSNNLLTAVPIDLFPSVRVNLAKNKIKCVPNDLPSDRFLLCQDCGDNDVCSAPCLEIVDVRDYSSFWPQCYKKTDPPKCITLKNRCEDNISLDLKDEAYCLILEGDEGGWLDVRGVSKAPVTLRKAFIKSIPDSVNVTMVGQSFVSSIRSKDFLRNAKLIQELSWSKVKSLVAKGKSIWRVSEKKSKILTAEAKMQENGAGLPNLLRGNE